MIEGIKNIFSYLLQEKEYSTFSGVVDIIVVKQPDDSLLSMPFHIRFGTLQVLDNGKERIRIYVNDKEVKEVYMLMRPEGACYFPSLSEEEGSVQGRLRPTSAQLQQFMLRRGYNKIEFVVESKLQGRQTIEGKIYLFDHDAKLVVSDIDGTVTKSDVRGHISTIMGKEWTHKDIAPLFTGIQKNGYKMVYLSSRPLYFYNYTHEYLRNIKQDGCTMPDGPILLSPDQIISSLNREVVYKKADEFKGALLKDIQRLFPQQDHPIYAGFGNRDTDATACLYAGVDINSIYIINEESIIEVLGTQQHTTYKNIKTQIAQLFPLLPKHNQVFKKK